MAIERLKQLEEEMQKCFRCNLCKMIPLPVVRNADFFDGCPAVREYAFHSYSGSGKQIMALSLLEGRIPADRALADVVYACNTCGNCDVACKFNMDAERMLVIMALREHMVDSGMDPAALRDRKDNLLAHGHPAKSPRRKAGAWAEGLNLKVLPQQKAPVLLLAGCMGRNDDMAAASTKKLAQLLTAAKVDFGILGDTESCCGLPAYWTGYRDAFTQIAKKNAELFAQSGVETIVTTSGSCFGALRAQYPAYGSKLQAKVVHASELLWELIRKNKLALTQPLKGQVAYHDPCYLGRRSEPMVEWQGESRLALGQMTYNIPSKPINYGGKGVYDAPRNILRAINGLSFKEMYRIREYTYCCGGGGGVPDTFPEMGMSAAWHRLDEAKSVGAEMLVTTCHECRAHLVGAQAGGKEKALPVVDLIDLVYTAAGIGK